MENMDLSADKLLLERIKLNKDEFANLYKRFYIQTLNYAFALTNDRHEAEDLVSKSFMEFYVKIQDYKWQDKPLKLWLFKNIRFTHLNQIRKSESKLKSDFDENTLSDEFEISFVDKVLNKDLIQRIQKELTNLPAEQREIINLKINEELSFKEISDLAARSENTCKTLFYRGIKKVKENLSKTNKAIEIGIILTVILHEGFINFSAHLPKPLFGKNIQNQTYMEKILTTKAAIIAAVSIGTIVVLTTTGLITYNLIKNQKSENKAATEQNNNQENNEQKINPTEEVKITETTAPTSSITITNTSTPTIVKTTTPTSTQTPTPIPNLIFNSIYGYKITLPGNSGYIVADGSDIYGSQFTSIKKGDAAITIVHVVGASGSGAVVCPCTILNRSVTNTPSGKVLSYTHVTDSYSNKISNVNSAQAKAINTNIVAVYMASSTFNTTLMDQMMQDIFSKLV